MSLASTIHINVRQKGRFGDHYIGYIPINPGSFKIGPNQVTHWYKLGPKPGKSSSKLRGDLQVTFQFLSKWSAKAEQDDIGIPDFPKGMLKRSSSDVKIPAMKHTDSAEGLAGRQNQSKNKREILASLRRSFRKKNKSPVFQNCDDDFASFSSQSASSTPQYIRKKTSSSIVPDNASNSLSSIGYLSNGMSDSDTGNSISHSPQSTRSSKGGQRTSEGEDVPVVDKSSRSSLEPRDKEQEDSTQDGKLVSLSDGLWGRDRDNLVDLG